MEVEHHHLDLFGIRARALRRGLLLRLLLQDIRSGRTPREAKLISCCRLMLVPSTQQQLERQAAGVLLGIVRHHWSIDFTAELGGTGSWGSCHFSSRTETRSSNTTSKFLFGVPNLPWSPGPSDLNPRDQKVTWKNRVISSINTTWKGKKSKGVKSKPHCSVETA